MTALTARDGIQDGSPPRVGDRIERIGCGALNALGLAAIAYLTAQALSGPALPVAWALEALRLVQLDARTEETREVGSIAW